MMLSMWFMSRTLGIRLPSVLRRRTRRSSVVLTTEEEGIGYLAGAWLGGERGALLMQSSGVGNCINTLGIAGQRAFSAADGPHHAR